jgi:hypothetical protein
MKKFVVIATLLLAGCATAPEEQETSTSPLLIQGPGSASFDPTGELYVYTEGMGLVIRKTGDPRTFLLTTAPPRPAAEKEEVEIEETGECVPVDPGTALPGPQGGWHGHPAWSPDGRFIAFMAPWEDGNCQEGDDADWDIWVVNVDGLDLESWVEIVSPDKDDPGKQNFYIVGPEGGLAFHQVTTDPGPEQRPTWATCRSLAYSTAEGVQRVDLTGIPGICEKTRAELDAEREQQIADLQGQVAGLRKKISDLEARITTLSQPVEPEQPGEPESTP